MTLLELEAEVYSATDLLSAQKLVSAYVEKERERAAERQRRSRASRVSQQRHRDAPHAHVVKTIFPNEEEKNSFALPPDWSPGECHRQRVEDEGREPAYLKRIERLFRSFVALKEITSSNWDARFGAYLEISFMRFPNLYRCKVAPSQRQSADLRASATPRKIQTPIPDATPKIVAQVIRLMDEGTLSESEIKRKLDAGDSEIRQASRLRHQHIMAGLK